MKRRLTLPLWLEIALAILVALALSNVVTIFLFRGEGELRLARFGADMLGQRVSSAASVVLKAPENIRTDLVRALSTPGMRLSLDAKPLVAETAVRDAATEAAISERLASEALTSVRVHLVAPNERVPRGPPPEPGPGRGAGAGFPAWAAEPPRPGAGPPPPEPPDTLLVSVAAGSGRWLNARFGMNPPRGMSSPFYWVGAAALSALLLVSLWIGGRVTQPLQRLAEAAGSLRRGELRGVVPETGPAPVREAARAFNAMSERVMAMLKSQRAMMAAVAHDLRTPIAVLRFRAELVNDEETRARLVETINEMQGMTEAVLDAVRFDGTGEPARTVDLGMLVDSLCVDMEEMGDDVAYESTTSLTCTCRAGEVRRAVRNLIENALRYGRRARVSVAAHDGWALVHVDDEGPGIPESDLERVFEPFARLDESRSKETGGYGLGLAIARLIARGHGGDVTLANRASGGLRAALTLPLG